MTSAVWPSWVCGIGSGPSNSDVRAGSEARAEKVRGATKRTAPSVRTGITWAPASTRRRQTSTALYTAMPPLTPRTTRRPSRSPTVRLLLDRFLGVLGARVGDLVGGDLLEGDRERLAGDRGHLGGHDGAQAVAQLAEIGVDLASALGRQAHEGELRVDLLEKVFDRGVHHGHARRALLRHQISWERCDSTIPASSSLARSRSSLTMTWSARARPSVSSSSASSRRARTSSSPSPRRRMRASSSSRDGGRTSSSTVSSG